MKLSIVNTVGLLFFTFCPVFSFAAGNWTANPGAESCCDCYVRTVATVTTDYGSSTTVYWDWVDCDPDNGGTGGSGGGTGDGGGMGGTGGGGSAGTDPRDQTAEAKFESAMCAEDNVLIVNQCNPDPPVELQCCFLNSDDGHLCTTCNCAGCCEKYWNCNNLLTQSSCWGCKMDCAVGFSGGEAAGEDDYDECDRYDRNPYM